MTFRVMTDGIINRATEARTDGPLDGPALGPSGLVDFILRALRPCDPHDDDDRHHDDDRIIHE